MRYMKKLRLEIEQLDFQISGHQRTMDALIEKRAELLQIQAVLNFNGYFEESEGEQEHE